MKLVIPIKADDIWVVLKNMTYFQRYLQCDGLIVITSGKLKGTINSDMNIEIIDEDVLIEGLSFDVLKENLDKRGAGGRTGWYFQQFLKLAYALTTDNDYYLIWDADTVPIKPIKMFDEVGHPFFDIKTEYHKPYFKTIQRLLHVGKAIKGSFISEHMLFRTEFVKEMINEIQRINPSQPWFFNIIDAINKKDLPISGFSEYETYGTYVVNKHPGFYKLRYFDSIRCGKKVFGELPSEEVCAWLSEEYSTISFENSHENLIHYKRYKNNTFRKIVKPYLFIICAEIFADTIEIPITLVKKISRRIKRIICRDN